MSENENIYYQKYESLINTPKLYKFNEEEEYIENEEFIEEEEQENDYDDDQVEENNQSESPENEDYQFRPESKQVDDPKDIFKHSFSLESLKERKTYNYFKSDYFYASFIDNTFAKKTKKLDFIGKYLLPSTSVNFFRLFGFQQITFNKKNASLDPFEYLKSISRKEEHLNEEESEKEWRKIKLQRSDGSDIEYKNVNLEECNNGNDEESVINWILGFHNYGMSHDILFTFAIFFDEEKINEEEVKKKFECSTFSVGKNYRRNRCFVTFTLNNYNPSILSLFTETIKELKDKTEKESFLSISDQLFLIADGTNSKRLRKKCDNKYNNEIKTPNYKIKFSKKSKEITLKQKDQSNTSRSTSKTIKKGIPTISLTSVSKLNLFLKSKTNFQITVYINMRYLNNFFNEPSYNQNSNDEFSFDLGGKSISSLYFKQNNPTNTLKTNEYRIFVGLNGVQYPKLISSHISLYSELELKTIYVDAKMDKIYCVFADEKSKQSKLIEGDFGTQKVDDMIIVQKLPGLAKNPKFFVDIKNILYLDFNSTTYKQNKKDRSWSIEAEKPSPESILKTDIPKISKSKEDNDIPNRIRNDTRYTTPIALEINKKLFLLNKTSQLYHPAWRNSTFRHGIISTFYRFAFHVLPDYFVFGKKTTEKVYGAIIYPQIDIGYRGNIKSIFTSSHMPGIFEYSDTAFNYTPLKDLLPYTKTDCLFFNNGELRVGLDVHRTKCQLAATSLFAFACTIYGPGMQIRDFLFGKGNPYAKSDFTLIHNFLIATYGTLLKMENESEFEYALDVIIEELSSYEEEVEKEDGKGKEKVKRFLPLNKNKEAYRNLMEELKKNYY